MQGRKEARGMGEAGLGWPCGPGQSLDSLLRATGSPGMVSKGGGLIRFGAWKGYSEVACGGEVGRPGGR